MFWSCISMQKKYLSNNKHISVFSSRLYYCSYILYIQKNKKKKKHKYGLRLNVILSLLYNKIHLKNFK